MSLLKVENLSVYFQAREGEVTAVSNLGFSLKRDECLGIVGESGSGKSQTANALMGLLADNARSEGLVQYNQQNLLSLSESELNQIRGHEITMIFQNPISSLNPYVKVGYQLMEVLQIHKGMNRKEAFSRSVQMLDAVKISEARQRMTMYPHELSGGMCQRVMIAMALLCRPKILIADEPTTALDVTVQAQIMELLHEVKQEFNTSIILITHDMGLVSSLCNKVLVLYAGKVMEHGPTKTILNSPQHPYTHGLLKAIPGRCPDTDVLQTIPGKPPNLFNLPEGCPFQDRCDRVMPVCKQPPALLPVNTDSHQQGEHLLACHLRNSAQN